MREPRQNTDAEIDALDAVCTRLAGFDAGIDTEWVDGYLTALASGPLVTAPEVWLPRLCGDAFERAFADMAQAKRLVKNDKSGKDKPKSVARAKDKPPAIVSHGPRPRWLMTAAVTP